MEYQRVKYIENVQIPVGNLEQSIAWYEANLGWRLKGRGDERLAFLELNQNSYVNLWQTDEETNINFHIDGEPMPAFVMVTEHIDRLHEDLKRTGTEIVKFTDEGFAKGLKFKDPSGNTLLVLEYKK
ncbi:VOC family protein [Paenibacillus ginsengarvi]|uniref:VOC family protein n=1 Tax=Paenibacillus ginsengarvi TaxID=400777 RepID=UPI0013156726|nr:VOC family protein [Paenibacillus ginsengarvi]